MGTPKPESIALFGGPKDGELIEVGAAPPLEFRVPMASSTFPALEHKGAELSTAIPEMRIGIYTPQCDVHGRVERDHAGHPIYEWRGEQQ